MAKEFNRRKHWEQVYETKNPDQVSWTQDKPQTSLDFIHSFGLNKSARIIDIGGGDSKLVDSLIEEGFENITVLDISAHSLEKAKKRLGEKASLVKWIVSDILDFRPEMNYDVWHDRAAFHFLTTSVEIQQYLTTAKNAVVGFITIATFSKNGPEKCSGLNVQQYTANDLTSQLEDSFVKLECITEDHITPFGTTQNFLFCSFKKI